jgi:hypothetical protein
MKTKIILDIKWLQEKRKTRPGKMIQTAEFRIIYIMTPVSSDINSIVVILHNCTRSEQVSKCLLVSTK